MGGYHPDFQEALDKDGSLGNLEVYMDLISSEEEAKKLWKAIRYSLKVVCKGDVLKEPRILDIGARKAYLIKYLRERLKIDAIGVDVDKRFTGEDQDLVLFGDAEDLPFSDSSFNIVLANGIFDPIYYINDIKKTSQEVARVLTKDGVFLTKDRKFRMPKEYFHTLYSELPRHKIDPMPVNVKVSDGEVGQIKFINHLLQSKKR